MEEKDVVTGYWGEASRLRAEGYALVSVSRGKPKNTMPDVSMPFLAPTWAMMKMGAEDYNASYGRILAGADPERVWSLLPAKSALMCFEKYPKWCHRRMLAEWLEESLGVEVTEFGLPRRSVISYRQMCGGGPSDFGRPPAGAKVYTTPSLFD